MEEREAENRWWSASRSWKIAGLDRAASKQGERCFSITARVPLSLCAAVVRMNEWRRGGRSEVWVGSVQVAASLALLPIILPRLLVAHAMGSSYYTSAARARPLLHHAHCAAHTRLPVECARSRSRSHPRSCSSSQSRSEKPLSRMRCCYLCVCARRTRGSTSGLEERGRPHRRSGVRPEDGGEGRRGGQEVQQAEKRQGGATRAEGGRQAGWEERRLCAVHQSQRQGKAAARRRSKDRGGERGRRVKGGEEDARAHYSALMVQ